MNIRKIILASNSPRRRELLEGLDIPFEVRVVQGIDESYPADLDVYDVAQYIAHKKALAYGKFLHEGIVVLTADTVVVAPYEDRKVDEAGKALILGKPKDEGDAERMLTLLSGKTHHVVTGVCLTTVEKVRQFSVKTEVTFKPLSIEEIRYYIAHYKPFDKAGAYGIQEWIGYVGCTGLKGSYYNVMGLPVQRVYQEMQSL